ncbi:MAG: TPM domain-containing protein [Clostridia bacterium]|nr:TPM domain-containing protein [Clostridia bacterium]
MKRISAIILALLFLFLFSVCSYAYTFDVMIDDRASLFSEEETERVDEAAYEFANSTEFSVAVVTTEDAMGKSAMEFADDYYDSLIFSSGWSENGILFLIDMDNREIYVSCAGLCIDEYSDYELNKIVDSGYFYVTEGEYADCIITMIYSAEKLSAESDDGSSYYEYGGFVPTYGGDYEEEYYYNDYTDAKNDFSLLHILIYIVVGLVAGGITVFAVKSSYKNIGKGDEFNADDISLELTASNDNVISKNVITTKIPKNNNNNHHRHGGGGGGGRVSVHLSSGGVRHSGAGRKF